ncbi:SpoIIE family protein phosphatase [Quadrisphaera sp. INWT6]|uniref:SpoIIE family protein phosphatase n=1 Tax=Quadrisphaera sp. INWT6 TaxID=2596917 RepID=UPI001891F82A|nr:SpoIIE family protein phosphatase [Quadrisphaera sp. INWT6]MBF5080791.1 SpoIIE family protein phosphatase [Quadrisphaera sp. INWT6]
MKDHSLQQAPLPDFRPIFDETPTPLLLLSPDFTIVHANRARLEATATTLEATVGRNLFEVFPMNPDDPAADGLVNLRDSLTQARDTRRPVTMAIQKYDIPLPDGTWVERYWSPRNVPILNEQGQVVWLLHRSDDITDYVHTREQARATTEQNEALRERADRGEADLFERTRELEQLVADLARATARTTQITESMAVGYLSMDADWRISYVNSQAVRALSRPREELVGGVIWELFPATVGTDFEAGYRRAATTGEAVTFDAHYPEPLNAWYEVRAVPEAEGVALYFLDITPRHDAVQAAQAAAARVSALAEVTLALSTIDDVTELVAVMAERGTAALGTDGGAVAIPARDDPQLVRSYVTASHAAAVREEYAVLPLDAPVPACEVMRTGHPVLLGDREASTGYSREMAHAVQASGSVAFASLPLLAGPQVIGVFTASWDTPQRFDAEQVELLGAFAAQCSQGLQRLTALDGERRARLQAEASAQDARRSAEDAQRSAEGQASLVAIARALSGADSEREVLDVLEGQGAALLAADGSGLALLEPDGRHVCTLASDTFDADLRANVQRVPVDFPIPIIHAAATGASHLFPDRASTVAAFPGAEPLYTAAGVQASACLPLRGRAGLLGSISLAFSGERLFSEEERDLLEAFAALTAQALDRIAAHAAEQAALKVASGIAETLQRSMLTAPPEPDHLEIAVRYAASAAHAEVGGDWYDAFLTSEGLTSLVIGDVTGHDMAAAAVMGQLRNLVRGIGFTLGEPPARVLAAVDRAAAGLGITTVATAIVAQVEQSPAHRAAGTRLLRWSNAGHLPPLLITADGQGSYLGSGTGADAGPEGGYETDLVLGWDPSTERHDHEVVLQPGSTVLLYTDGLVERRGVGLDRGLAWLAEAAGELVSSTGAQQVSLEELCDGLLQLVGDHLDDDVALLALRAHPEDAPRPTQAGPSHVPDGLQAARAAAAAHDPLGKD